jgi:tRNA(Ile)-lysidine synthase
MFLRLIRGANISGVTSLRGCQQLKGLAIIRPLLDVTRREIEEFLHERGICEFRRDSSNDENDFRRNYLRNVLLKKLFSRFADAERGLLTAYDAVRCDAEFIEQSARRISDAHKEGASLPLDLLRGTHPAVLIRVLRYWLSDRCDGELIPDGNLLHRVIVESAKFAGRAGMREIEIPAGDGKILVMGSAGIRLPATETAEALEPCQWKWKKNRRLGWGGYLLEARTVKGGDAPEKLKSDDRTAYFDAAKFPATLVLRRWCDGDRMIPFGFEKPVKVKKIFEGRKIPARMRSQIPLVCLENGDILWMPGVRRANFAPVGPETCETVVLRAKY